MILKMFDYSAKKSPPHHVAAEIICVLPPIIHKKLLYYIHHNMTAEKSRQCWARANCSAVLFGDTKFASRVLESDGNIEVIIATAIPASLDSTSQ
jgi:hypothetical protein